MPENIDDVDDHVDEEGVVLDDETALEDLEPTPEEIAEATVPPEPGLENVESIQDLLAKQETLASTDDVDDTPAIEGSLSSDEPVVAPDGHTNLSQEDIDARDAAPE